METGTPKRGPRDLVRVTFLSAARASAMAESGTSVQKALILGLTSSILFRTASITSEGLTLLEAIILLSCQPDIFHSSAIVMFLSHLRTPLEDTPDSIFFSVPPQILDGGKPVISYQLSVISKPTEQR
jgi:hypothetical protein